MDSKRNSKRFLTLIISSLFVFLFPSMSSAIDIRMPDAYVFTSSGGPFVVYDVNTGEPVRGATNYYEGYEITSDFLSYTPGDYTIVEMSSDGVCQNFVWTYDHCVESPYFVQIVDTFTLLPALGGGGAEEEQPSFGGGLAANSYPPDVSILVPQKGLVFSKDFLIDYKTRLQNDRGVAYEDDPKATVNLTPVSLYYSDKLSSWSGGFLNPADKILIAKDLPAVGQYAWNIKDLVPGTLYRIIVNALDASGRIGEKVSELFGVDFTAPTFVVTVNPPVAKHEKVTITVVASEDLPAAPTVSVRQRGGKLTPVEMIAGDNHIYSGVYNVVDGFDGTAHVEVSGTDAAGNVGDVIVGGGTFTVGINPPVKPIIISPLQNAIATSEKIDIQGTTREDTTITATVNGVGKYTAKPNEKGEFILKDVLLKKNAINGKNIINITATDTLDVASDGTILTVLFNMPPTIKILRPVSAAILSGMTVIGVQASDENTDPIRYRYEIAGAKKTLTEELAWQSIADASADSINIDTTKFVDGVYSLRVTADDGVTTTLSSVVPITIRNESSFFIRFYDGLRTIVKEKSATIRGVVYAQKNISPAPTIKGLWYSTTDGAKWIKVSPQDGFFDSSEERFSVVIPNLKDGTNIVLWKTRDSRGIVADSEQPVIVDNTPPTLPSILFPIDGGMLTAADNESKEKNTFSVTLRGTSEPESIVSVTINGTTVTGKTSFDGTFRIPGITLPSHGAYTASVFATDEAGNVGASRMVSFLYNNPPTVVFISPRDGHGVEKQAVISWLTNDSDGDVVTNTLLSYHQLGKPFVTIAKDIKGNSITWDTTTIPEGTTYELRFEASDGLTTTVTRVPFSVDHSVPALSSFVVKQSTIAKGDTIEAHGVATDTSSGVDFVEYRFVPVDTDTKSTASIPWYKATIVSVVPSKSVSFSIKNHSELSDGMYIMVARAVDAAGNVSSEESQPITVDSTAPRVGSFEITSDGVQLLPTNDVFNTVVETPLAVSVSLEHDTVTASLMYGDISIPLIKDLATGLWKGTISFDQTGSVSIIISAVDAARNTVEGQKFANFSVAEKSGVSLGDKKEENQSLWDKILHMLHLR